MLVRGVDPCNLGHAQYVLYPRLPRDGAGNAAVDAEDVLVNDGREGDAVEDLVRLFPDSVADLLPEPTEASEGMRRVRLSMKHCFARAQPLSSPLPALVYVAPLPIVLLPSVNIPSLVVPPKQEHLVRQEELHGEKVGDDLEAGEAAVDVVAQEEEVAGG